jgi:ATP-dependent DNA helicase RecQ
VLRGERPVLIALAAPEREPRAVSRLEAADPAQGALYERLRELRKRLANEQGLPPYVIFHDATLREMALRRPLTLAQFADLPGVGQAKLARYGESFINALRQYPA